MTTATSHFPSARVTSMRQRTARLLYVTRIQGSNKNVPANLFKHGAQNPNAISNTLNKNVWIQTQRQFGTAASTTLLDVTRFE